MKTILSTLLCLFWGFSFGNPAYVERVFLKLSNADPIDPDEMLQLNLQIERTVSRYNTYILVPTIKDLDCVNIENELRLRYKVAGLQINTSGIETLKNAAVADIDICYTDTRELSGSYDEVKENIIRAQDFFSNCGEDYVLGFIELLETSTDFAEVYLELSSVEIPSNLDAISNSLTLIHLNYLGIKLLKAELNGDDINDIAFDFMKLGVSTAVSHALTVVSLHPLIFVLNALGTVSWYVFESFLEYLENCDDFWDVVQPEHNTTYMLNCVERIGGRGVCGFNSALSYHHRWAGSGDESQYLRLQLLQRLGEWYIAYHFDTKIDKLIYPQNDVELISIEVRFPRPFPLGEIRIPVVTWIENPLHTTSPFGYVKIPPEFLKYIDVRQVNVYYKFINRQFSFGKWKYYDVTPTLQGHFIINLNENFPIINPYPTIEVANSTPPIISTTEDFQLTGRIFLEDNICNKFISEASVQVNDNQAEPLILDENGEFSRNIFLSSLFNKVTITTNDNVGNFSKKELTIEKKNLQSLTLGAVNPRAGFVNDPFQFSVNFKDNFGSNPQSVDLVLNGTIYILEKTSGDIKTGAIYSKNINISKLGSNNFHFEAVTYDGNALRFPPGNDISFDVTENSEGWEIATTSINATPKFMLTAENINVSAVFGNLSDTDEKIYLNVPYKFEIFGPSGILEDSESGTISSITPNSNLTKTAILTPTNVVGTHLVLFTLLPNKDTNVSNNSQSIPIIIGQSGPTREYFITSAWRNKPMSESTPSYTYNNYTYTINSISNSKLYITKGTGDQDQILLHDFKEYNTYKDILIFESANTIGDDIAYVSFGSSGSQIIQYVSTNVSGFPGEVVILKANCISTYSFSSYNPDFYRDTPVEDWYDDLTLSNNNKTCEYEFEIPSNQTPGIYTFYMGAEMSSGEYVRQVSITVLPFPPKIASISNNKICSGDIITITGSYFGTSGTVKFGDKTSQSIISWGSGTIQCVVPPGISPANIQVINPSSSASNGMPYSVGTMNSPAFFSASKGEFCNQVQLTWDAVPSAVYDLFKDVLLIEENLNTSGYIDLTNSTLPIVYGIIAKGNCGMSTLVSDVGNIKDPIGKPGYVDASDGNFCDKIALQWGIIPDAVSYNIYRDGNLVGSTTTVTAFEDTECPNGEITYSVCGVGPCGEGSTKSDTGFMAETTAMSTMQASKGDFCNQVLLSWNEVPGANSYNVYRDGVIIASGISGLTFSDFNATTSSANYSLTSMGHCGESNLLSDSGYISYLNSSLSEIILSKSSGLDSSITVNSNTSWSISENSNWISVEPLTGVNTATLTITVLENAGSSRSTTISISGCQVTKTVIVTQESGITNTSVISGTVFHDINRMTDNIVNGTGTNPQGALYVNLVDNAGMVVNPMLVNIDGTFSFLNVPAGNYTVQISVNQGTVGSAMPETKLPAYWIHTGEHQGSGTGSDGTADGLLAVTVDGDNDLPEANFGIVKLPDLTASMTASPNVMNGITSFNLIVKATELNGVNTEGPIKVSLPRDERWSFDGPYDSSLTMLGSSTLNNNVWSYDGSDANYHIFTSTTVISGGNFSTFGFKVKFDPMNTRGIFTITTQFQSGSGGEIKVNNNTDSEKLDYFSD